MSAHSCCFCARACDCQQTDERDATVTCSGCERADCDGKNPNGAGNAWPNVERRKTFDDIDARRESWKVRNAGHSDVVAWLAKNPPDSPEWRGDLLDWAWLEMPFAPE